LILDWSTELKVVKRDVGEVIKEDQTYYFTVTFDEIPESFDAESKFPIETVGSVAGETMKKMENGQQYMTFGPEGEAKFTMTGGKVTGNNQVYLFSLNGTANVTGVDFTGNESLVLRGNGDPSKSSTFTNCKFSAGSTYKIGDQEFNYDFQFGTSDAGITFADCDFDGATFSNRSAFKFVDGNGVESGTGSLFGGGSFTVIVSILSLVVSVACMVITFSLKKKLVPVTANGAAESDDKE
jgi:hypothetical protein